MTSAPVLLTGATGYVGSRLLRVLEERGQRVRCLTRRPEAVALHRDTTIVAGDVRELEGASAGRVFAIEPRGHREAIARALANEDRELAETRWSDAVSSAGPRPERYGGVRHGKRLVDTRSIRVRVSPEQAFRPIRRIGGETGWYFGDRVWRLRGFVDLLAGGVGARRGRRDPETPTVDRRSTSCASRPTSRAVCSGCGPR
jgi:hypothetical protein